MIGKKLPSRQKLPSVPERNCPQAMSDNHDQASAEMLDAARALALNKSLNAREQLAALKTYDSLLKSRLDDSKVADVPEELRKFIGSLSLAE